VTIRAISPQLTSITDLIPATLNVVFRILFGYPVIPSLANMWMEFVGLHHPILLIPGLLFILCP